MLRAVVQNVSCVILGENLVVVVMSLCRHLVLFQCWDAYKMVLKSQGKMPIFLTTIIGVEIL